MAMSSMVVNTIQKNLGVMLTRHDENYNGSRKLQKPFLGLSSFRQSSFSIIHSIRGQLLLENGDTLITPYSSALQQWPRPPPLLLRVRRKIRPSRCASPPDREVEPDVDFTAEDFCMAATSAIERIVEQGRVPIIVGGSNSFVEALVQNPSVEFKSRYEPCFIWLNVAPPILDTYLSKRVDDMVRGGLVEEVKAVFSPNLDYKRGIYRSIGVPEMDAYLRADRMVGYIERETLLKEAIDDIKANTCKLASKQVGKIETLRNKLGWNMHQIDTTPVFEKCGEEADAAWEMLVKKPTFGIIDSFLT
ncbi:Adenylate isopentenyltransferase 5, chloroplastic [Vitis vinifera]|uniref:Adenylate isopentenyltransferase 5, chloroplastic n=1 Tax=Vitis vinifera TaxID=29760 RepID=A0A438J7Q4_VITVI|nr:Adenylate isopentenyltransferase 5, chloroplastic [Vitis vinifera]